MNKKFVEWLIRNMDRITKFNYWAARLILIPMFIAIWLFLWLGVSNLIAFTFNLVVYLFVMFMSIFTEIANKQMDEYLVSKIRRLFDEYDEDD